MARGYEQVTGTSHRPLETIQGYVTIETPGGFVDPIEEGEANVIVTYWSDEMVRMAMGREMHISP